MPKSDREREWSYKPHTKEQVDKRATQSGGNRDWYLQEDVKTFTPKEGKKGNNIRILPATWDGAEHWGMDLWVHFEIGPDKAAFLCPKEMKGEKCPICEEKARAVRQNKGDEEYIRSLTPTKRVGMYIIDRANEEDGPTLWIAPFSVDKEICKHVVHKRTGELRQLDSPTEGHDVYFEREGTKRNTKYSGFEVDNEENAVSKAVMRFIKDNPIPSILQYYDYDYIKNVFTAGEEVEEDDDKYSKKSKSSGRKFVDDDEEEEEKPKKKAASKKSSDDDDEEEEKPKKKKKEEEEEEEEEEETHSWDDIHAMRRRKLEQIALDKTDLEVDELEDVDDDDLADMICKELKIKNPKKAKKKVEEEEEEEEEKPKDKKSSARERLKKLRKKDEEDED